MNDKVWVPIKKGAPADAPAAKTVRKSGLAAVRGVAFDQVEHRTTTVTYALGGLWQGAFTFRNQNYDTLAAPRGGAVTEEGAPELPQEGIFVAVPNGATNISVRLVRKTMQQLDGVWRVKPAPKPITEAEYIAGKEEYRPRPEIYDSDNEYPGKDFDYLGLKSLEGVPVAHVLIYLAQYKPRSGSLSVVKSMTLEIGYDVPPQTDAVPRARSLEPMLGDMILDFDNVQQIPMDSAVSFAPAAADAGPVLKRTDIISEYVIITTPALVASVQPLLNAKSGWPHYARVADTQTIAAEFPAANLKESIRSFLSWAWGNWTVPPRFVVLAGDVDAIPVHVYTQYTIDGENPRSDHYYADIQGNLSPEIVVSRIPSSNAARVQQICQNLAQYPARRGTDWGGWQNQVVLVAYQGDTYKQCSNDIATAIAPRFNVTKLYGDASTRQQVIDKMNAGVLVANYRGHGAKTEWSSANGLRTAEIRALNNGQMPPLVFCICCQNAWIDDQGTEVVVETFLREGKCVAVLGATRNSPTGANNDFDKYLWQAVMDWGEVTPGGIVQRAKALMVQNQSGSVAHQEDVVLYMLSGDPTAKVISTVEFLRGTWGMEHDGWKGVLVINRIWNARVEKIGACGYPVWDISGTYTGQDGKPYAMTGKIGGRDPNDRNAGCKRSDHKVVFTIAFPNNNQGFEGYVFTWTQNVMAGYTWWSNRPFGWYARKR